MHFQTFHRASKEIKTVFDLVFFLVFGSNPFLVQKQAMPGTKLHVDFSHDAGYDRFIQTCLPFAAAVFQFDSKGDTLKWKTV